MQDFAGLKKEWKVANDFRKEGIINDMEKLCTPEAEDFIRGVLASQEYYHVRGWAARALRRTADPRTIAALISKLEWDMNLFVKSMCAASIAKNAEYINTLDKATREKVVAALREASGNDDLGVRQKAVLGLARFMDSKSQDVMVKTIGKLGIMEGVTDYEEISLALCWMGALEAITVLAFARTMELSQDLALAEKMVDATDKLLRRKHMDETWRARLMGAIRLCRNRLDANKRPSGESFVDKTLGIRFDRPGIAKPIPPALPNKVK